MRILGAILVALGALVIGWQGFNSVKADRAPEGVAQEPEREAEVPQVMGGIVVVSGLILLASANRRDDG